MKVGQRVRLKPSSGAARYWNVPPDAQGTVMCSYRLPASKAATAERLDVRFTPRVIIWGGAATEFEAIGDAPEWTLQ